MLPILLTKNELRRFFPNLDPRTVIARHALDADAVIISGGVELLVYRLEKIQELAQRTNSIGKRFIL